MDETYPARLIHAIAEGNNEAFARLFDLMYMKVYRFASYFIRLREDREEVVSEVFRTIWQNRHLLTGVRNLESYIYVVTRNESYKLLRAHSKYRHLSIDEMPVELVLPDPSGETQLIDHETMQVYREAIDELPERCKLIFLMVREERLRYKEIAEILSITEGTVERQINIATKKIVETVRKRMPGLKIRKKSNKDCG